MKQIFTLIIFSKKITKHILVHRKYNKIPNETLNALTHEFARDSSQFPCKFVRESKRSQICKGIAMDPSQISCKFARDIISLANLQGICESLVATSLQIHYSKLDGLGFIKDFGDG